MLDALKSFPSLGQTETVFVTRRDDAAKGFHELSRVVVVADVRTIEDDLVKEGSTGTVVAVWDKDDLFDVEFESALGPATIAGSLLRPA